MLFRSPGAFDCIDSQGLPRISVHPKGGMVITFDLSLRDVDAGPCRDSYHCWFMVTPELLEGKIDGTLAELRQHAVETKKQVRADLLDKIDRMGK